jgi:hypothetical protein
MTKVNYPWALLSSILAEAEDYVGTEAVHMTQLASSFTVVNHRVIGASSSVRGGVSGRQSLVRPAELVATGTRPNPARVGLGRLGSSEHLGGSPVLNFAEYLDIAK